jgi:hypothetical protein
VRLATVTNEVLNKAYLCFIIKNLIASAVILKKFHMEVLSNVLFEVSIENNTKFNKKKLCNINTNMFTFQGPTDIKVKFHYVLAHLPRNKMRFCGQFSRRPSSVNKVGVNALAFSFLL